MLYMQICTHTKNNVFIYKHKTNNPNPAAKKLPIGKQIYREDDKIHASQKTTRPTISNIKFKFVMHIHLEIVFIALLPYLPYLISYTKTHRHKISTSYINEIIADASRCHNFLHVLNLPYQAHLLLVRHTTS